MKQTVESPTSLKVLFSVTHGAGGGGGGVTRVNFCWVYGYVPLGSQSPYPFIVYSVANYRPRLSHLWANM